MEKISEKVSEIANSLNQKRLKAYIDIYKETEFSGLGVLVDEELNVYKYMWNLGFNRDTHSFSNNNYLYKSKKKADYNLLEKYLINDLNIIEKEYLNDSNEEEKYSEIIRLNNYVNEFSNCVLYDKIKEKISDMIKEEL